MRFVVFKSLLVVVLVSLTTPVWAQPDYAMEDQWAIQDQWSTHDQWSTDCGCGDVVCDGECELEPIWSATFEYVWLGRSKPDSQLLFARPFNGPPFTPLLNANQLTFEVATGTRATLKRHSFENLTFEFSYLGLYDQDANATRTFDDMDANPANDPFMQIFDQRVGSSTSYAVAYTTDLNSFELNAYLARHWRIQPTMGLRWIRLSEQLRMLDWVDRSHEALIRTENDLVGGQLGLQGRLWDRGGWFYVDASAKGGVFHNMMALKNHVHGAAVGTIDRSLNGTSLAAEFDITAVWQLTDNFSIRFGYLGLFLNRIALATDQLGQFQTATQAGTPDLNYINYHGGHFGLNIDW